MPEIAAFQLAVLEEGRRGGPGDRRGNDDPEAANRRGRDHAQQRARCVDERAAREALVHECVRAQDLIDRAAASGRQRAADDGNDARAGRRRIAPRAPDGEREVTHARQARPPAQSAPCRARRLAERPGSLSDPTRPVRRRACGRRDAGRAGRPRGRAHEPSSTRHRRHTQVRWRDAGGPAPARPLARRGRRRRRVSSRRWSVVRWSWTDRGTRARRMDRPNG